MQEQLARATNNGNSEHANLPNYTIDEKPANMVHFGRRRIGNPMREPKRHRGLAAETWVSGYKETWR